MNSYKLFSLVFVIFFFGCKKDEEIIPVEDVPKVMLEQVNKLRKEGCRCGSTMMPPVHELKWNILLEAAAFSHASDMNSKHYFEHIAPDGSSPIQRAIREGYTGLYVGENIAKGYKTINKVMAAWQNSEGHCLAMMDSLYYEMGAAKSNDYWVQEFGRPDSLTIDYNR